MKKHCIVLNLDELNHIHAAVHNMALDYIGWATDNANDKEVYDDYIESFRQLFCLEQKIESVIEQAKNKEENNEI